MISLEHVTYRYPNAPIPALNDLTFTLDEGEFVLVVGPSGAGKSTFLRSLNGLVPHFYGGTWSGRMRVLERDPVALGPRGMSDLVGFVFQEPDAQFVVETVEDELVFALENHAISQATMRKRVEEVLDQLDIARLRHRRISTLSGGEKQRVAIAAVLTLQPRILVLDEPTSQLDPQAAEEVLTVLRQLNQDLGLTVILSEHRLERVVQYADRMLSFPALGAKPMLDEPRRVLAHTMLSPPLVTLAKVIGWQPLPLTLKEARKFAGPLKEQLAATKDSGLQVASFPKVPVGGNLQPATPPTIQVENLSYSYDGVEALHNICLAATRGEFVALMGRNGSGKTTLLKQLVGLLRPARGQVMVANLNIRQTPLDQITLHVGYVPQNPDALLFADTLAEELSFTRKNHGLPAHGPEEAALLDALGLRDYLGRYPRDLSGGERQRAALAAILVANPDIILLDEPTRGLDYPAKEALTRFLLAQKAANRTIIMATHDVELVARCADRVVLMGEGEIVLDAPARTAMTESLVFASQVNKLLRDPRYVTVADVLEGLKGA